MYFVDYEEDNCEYREGRHGYVVKTAVEISLFYGGYLVMADEKCGEISLQYGPDKPFKILS